MLHRAFSDLRYSPFFYILCTIGLALGFIVAFFLLHFILVQSQYDSHHQHAENIVRVETRLNLPNGESIYSAQAALPIADKITNYYPNDIQLVTRLARTIVTLRQDTITLQEPLYFADEWFFETLTLHSSEPRTLKRGEAIISDEFARKLFGSLDVVGKTITVNDQKILTVKQVIELLPQTHFDFGIVTSINDTTASEVMLSESDWYEPASYIYLQLVSPERKERIADSLRGFVGQNAPQIPGAPFLPEDFIELSLRSIGNLHVNIGLNDEMRTTVNLQTKWMLIGAMAAIFLICSLNYFNLAVIIEYSKSVEYALKMILGGGFTQLFYERIGSILVAIFVVLAFSLPALYILQSIYSRYDPIKATFQEMLVSQSGLLSLAFVVIVILGSTFASLFISTRRPITGVVVGRYKRKAPALIRGLFVFAQVIAAGILLSLGAAMVSQMDYIDTVNPGYDTYNTAFASVSNLQPEDVKRLPSFADRLRASNAVDEISFASWVPFAPEKSVSALHTNTPSVRDGPFIVGTIQGDGSFFRLWNVPILAGSIPVLDLDSDEPAPETSIAINRSAVLALGLDEPAAAINMMFYSGEDEASESFRVEAVFEDFQLGSVEEQIEPILYQLSSGGRQYISVRVKNSTDLNLVNAAWQNTFSGQTVSFTATDDTIADAYTNRYRVMAVIVLAAGFAILFTLMGLIAMTAYEASRLKRNLAVMEAIGGSRVDLLGFFLARISMPIIAGSAITFLCALYIVDNWLAQFSVAARPASTIVVASTSVLLVISFISTATTFLISQLGSVTKRLQN